MCVFVVVFDVGLRIRTESVCAFGGVREYACLRLCEGKKMIASGGGRKERRVFSYSIPLDVKP